MEWIVGIYLAIGLYKVGGKLIADVPDQPMWMYSQKNPLIWALYFCMYVAAWPIAATKK